MLHAAFKECRACLKDVYGLADAVIDCPGGTPPEFRVRLERIPAEFFSLRKNIFSSLFQSMYGVLGIPEERRMLYGKLNYLFRIWVTSADNLLDGEDKVSIPMRFPGDSRVMRQIVSIMTADRVMQHILGEAVARKVVSQKEAESLSYGSLQVLLPSAAEEASEEGGIRRRPEPEYVLDVIHRLKTGILFHIPFLGPDRIEKDIDGKMRDDCKEGLGKFGLGCQLLDDIRDMAKDYLEKRHNYVLSKIVREGKKERLLRLKSLSIDTTSNIFPGFPEVVRPAAALAAQMMEEGLLRLNEYGLGLGASSAGKIAVSMFDVLDVGELRGCARPAAGH